MSSAARTWRQRSRFSTFADTFEVTPLRFYAPQSLADIIEIVEECAARGYRVRAVGTAHSWSDVALCPDVMMDMRGLDRPLDKETNVLRRDCDPENLFRVEAGMLVRDLAAVLKSHGKALPNISGFTGQTIVGAAQTATHGTGLVTGPLSSFITSLDVVNGHGQVIRVEPTDGVTVPAAFRAAYPKHLLIQDDSRFDAITVSMGCMGIIYAVYVQTVPYYFLREDRTISTWQEVKSRIPERIAASRHYEFSLNPYPRDGKNTCLELIYTAVSEPIPAAALRAKRKPMLYIFSALPGATLLLRCLLASLPQLSPAFLDFIMKSLQDRGVISGYEVALTLGTLTDVVVQSCEFALPISRCVAAVDAVIHMAQEARKEGVYHSIPVIIRFVKKTPSYLAMQYGKDDDDDFCMVECPCIVGTRGAMEQMNRYERALYAIGGRPHWGQFNYLSGSNEMIQVMYPRFDAWLDAFHEFNDIGMFDSAFTDRLGFSRRPRTPSA